MPDIKIKMGLVVFVLVALAPARALAQVVESAVCERYGITRMVELRVEGPTGVPCNVSYLKPDEGGTEEQLWFARNDASYCVSRYAGFLVKLETELEWICEERAVEATAVDDAALSEAPLVSDVASGLAVVETIAPSETVGSVVSGDDEVAVLAVADSGPELQAAFPVARFPTDINQTGSEQVSSKLDFATVRSRIPSGFYTMHPSIAHEGTVRNCPADGYFVWNNQEQDKPVFEMGPILEFAIRLDDTSIVDEFQADTIVADISSIETLADADISSRVRQDTAGGSAEACMASVHYSACHGFEAQQGTGHWDINDASFTCDAVAAKNSVASAEFALFQNREYSATASRACAGSKPITHMALRSLSGLAENADVQISGIELVIVRALGNKLAQTDRAVCRYVRG